MSLGNARKEQIMSQNLFMDLYLYITESDYGTYIMWFLFAAVMLEGVRRFYLKALTMGFFLPVVFMTLLVSVPMTGTVNQFLSEYGGLRPPFDPINLLGNFAVWGAIASVVVNFVVGRVPGNPFGYVRRTQNAQDKAGFIEFLSAILRYIKARFSHGSSDYKTMRPSDGSGLNAAARMRNDRQRAHSAVPEPMADVEAYGPNALRFADLPSAAQWHFRDR